MIKVELVTNKLKVEGYTFKDCFEAAAKCVDIFVLFDKKKRGFPQLRPNITDTYWYKALLYELENPTPYKRPDYHQGGYTSNEKSGEWVANPHNTKKE